MQRLYRPQMYSCHGLESTKADAVARPSDDLEMKPDFQAGKIKRKSGRKVTTEKSQVGPDRYRPVTHHFTAAGVFFEALRLRLPGNQIRRRTSSPPHPPWSKGIPNKTPKLASKFPKASPPRPPQQCAPLFFFCDLDFFGDLGFTVSDPNIKSIHAGRTALCPSAARAFKLNVRRSSRPPPSPWKPAAHPAQQLLQHIPCLITRRMSGTQPMARPRQFLRGAISFKHLDGPPLRRANRAPPSAERTAPRPELKCT